MTTPGTNAPTPSDTGTHIAALFEDAAAAHAAQAALVAAGVDPTHVLVVDRSWADRPAESPDGLWGTLKHMLVPDEHAHAYAEGVARGHALVLADATDAETDRAVAALRAAQPIDVDKRADAWTDDGWDGVNGGQDYWLDAQAERDAARSEGITAGGIISGDYGSVGAPIGGRSDTNILRGLSRFAGVREDGVPVNDDSAVRVYRVG